MTRFRSPSSWTLQQKIEHYSIPEPNSGCYLWLAGITSRGYGQIGHEGRMLTAHRAAWTAFNGPVPVGLMVLHRCDNRPCVSPTHLYLGTHADNMDDMVRRRRYHAAIDPLRCVELGRQAGLMNTWSKGERNIKAKLNELQVSEIKCSTEKTRYLARRYQVNRTTIQRIRSGARWQIAKERV